MMTVRTGARQAVALVTFLATLAVPAVASAQVTALTFEEVLESLERTHPKLEQARRKIDKARAEALGARGAFDVQLDANAEGRRIDEEKRYGLWDVTLNQPLMPLGINIYAGWRGSSGPVSDWKDQFTHSVAGMKGWTNDPLSDPMGELHAGATVSLLKNRAFDDRRAARRDTALGVDVATMDLGVAWNGLVAKAAGAYWGWVASGQQLQIARDLLRLAELRQEQIAEQVRRGAFAPIELIENERSILKRRGEVLKAERKFRESAVKLSLYLRDMDNQPVRPSEARVPDALPSRSAPLDANLEELIERSLDLLPEWRRLQLERQRLDLKRRLARNSLNPKLDAQLGVGRAVHIQSLFATPEVLGALKFSMPLQMREARGKLNAADADIARLDAERRQLRDTIAANIREAFVGLEVLTQQIDVTRRELDISQQVERAERDRFALGASSLLIVNLREQATADAAARLVDVEAEFQAATARWLAITGQVNPVSADADE
ncbi:MAG: TolC family protein [Myxococcota bacterium]